jgi:hypothetical protein
MCNSGVMHLARFWLKVPRGLRRQMHDLLYYCDVFVSNFRLLLFSLR